MLKFLYPTPFKNETLIKLYFIYLFKLKQNLYLTLFKYKMFGVVTITSIQIHLTYFVKTQCYYFSILYFQQLLEI